MGANAARTVRTFADPVAVSDALAESVVEAGRERIASAGRFTLALAGGETPRAAYALIAARYRDALDWARVHVFFTDERFVPPADPKNNAAMIVRVWLSRIAVPRDQVHAIPTIGGGPVECAERYERTLRGVLTGDVTFDLAVMGIGADGHTASLFPGDAALSERHRWVVAVEAPAGTEPRSRITLTVPVLNGSRRVLFAAVGEAKRTPVADALAGAPLPAAMIHGVESTEWLIDAAAA